MSLSKEQRAFTKDVASLIIYADMIGIGLTLGDAYRSKSQMILNYFGYKLEVDKKSVFGFKIVKHKKLSNTLNSLHGKRLAIDFNFFINDKLTYDKHKLVELGKFWESLNPKNKWGGNFKNFIDTPHFERRV